MKDDELFTDEDYPRMSSGQPGAGFGFGLGTAGSLFLVALICGGLYGCPQYSVYQQKLEGEAELAKAQFSKQAQVADAQGKLDAAKLLAQVEVARANGAAQANKIIGESLKDNEAYLKYLWITDVAGNQANKPSVIYVPTEANLPILEAGRHASIPPK